MRPALVFVIAVAVLVSAGSASPRTSATAGCSPLLLLPRAAPAGEFTLFGHIKSLKRKGARFELRFDPASWLTGVTAARASLEDTGSSDVPNDYYIREEGHRLLTYKVPATTPVSVLTRGTCTTRTTAARLAKSLPPAGFWIRVRIDTVRSLDQQYQP
jgi:hypothetical protein